MPASFDGTFQRVTVDFLVTGTARVSWELHRNFVPPDPWTFQLQYSEAGTPSATDWENVGLPTEDFFAVDPQRRLFAKDRAPSYRVIVTTPLGAHESPTAPIYGVLGRRDWLEAREIVRQERLRQKQICWDGWLLKRKHRGETPNPRRPAIAATDPLTGEILTRGKLATVGTEFVGGYYPPYPFFMDVSPESWDPTADEPGGNTDIVIQSARTIAFPRCTKGDVFIHRGSDRRFAIHKVAASAQLRGVPLIVNCELRLLAASDVINLVDTP